MKQLLLVLCLAGIVQTSYTQFGNTKYGDDALYSNNTGSYNAAFGYHALYSNTYGTYNTANGYDALYSNASGYYNTANGFFALHWNTTGHSNTANGERALFMNTSGYHNTANGKYALFYNTTGNSNTANGIYALYSNTTGEYNTANGSYALYYNQAHSNTATGSYALFYNTTGYSNTANGSYALYYTTNGDYNTANGHKSLYSNTTGSNNTANGYNALYSNTTGGYNTANGSLALRANTTGSHNTVNGYQSLYFNTTGSSNIANGYYSLGSNTTGSYNTANGRYALFTNTIGSNNTALGRSADVLTGNLQNATAIGYSATVDASNKVRIGNTSVTSIGGQVAWTTFSDGRYKKNIKQNVKGLAFINGLRPITYTVDVNSLNEFYDKEKKFDSAYEQAKASMKQSTDEASKIVYNGFVAQEVEAAAKKLGYDFSGVDKPQAQDGLYGLRYSDFVVPLVKAVQELSAQNDSKDAALTAQQKTNADLQKQIDDLKALLIAVNTSSLPNISGNTQSVTLSSPVGGVERASLQQNTPNPFNQNTVIKYFIPQQTTNAVLKITSANGQEIKSIALTTKGNGQVNLQAASLSAGIYQYTLLVDGRMMDSKKMVLIN